MPWKEICTMDERLGFIADCLEGGEPMTMLCARYGISRKTGYKWLSRYRAQGPEGLRERSRAPRHPAHGLETIEAEIVKLRERFPFRVKLGIRLERIDPGKQQQNGRHGRMHRILKQETS